MSDLVPFDQACDRIFGLIDPLGLEVQDTRYAENFVLAQDAIARRTSPAFDLSAMDGYAVRSQDISPGTTLNVIGSIAAGGSASAALKVSAGQAVRIFTGAPLPPGADAVLIQENTKPGDEHSDKASSNNSNNSPSIVATQGVRPGQFVRPKGLDFEHGDTLVNAGTKISAAHLALLLSGGIDRVKVRRHPAIEIFSTGDELVEVGDWSPESSNTLPSSNAPMLRALLGKHGFGAFVQPIVSDSADALAARFDTVRHDANLVISTGGASVGDHDIVRQFLNAQADEIFIEKIAMRPGKPVMLARFGTLWWLALPGNPVSSFVTGLIFGVGICQRMSGNTDPWPQYRDAVLGVDLPPNDQRLEFMRAHAEGGKISTYSAQDSSMIKNLANANALLVRPAHAGAQKKGDSVRFIAI